MNPQNAPNSVDIGPYDRHIYSGITFYRVHRRPGGAHYVHDALYQAVIQEMSAQGLIRPILIYGQGRGGFFHMYRKGTFNYVKYARPDTGEVYMVGYRSFRAVLFPRVGRHDV